MKREAGMCVHQGGVTSGQSTTASSWDRAAECLGTSVHSAWQRRGRSDASCHSPTLPRRLNTRHYPADF